PHYTSNYTLSLHDALPIFEYLSNKLRQFGVEPVLQPFMYEGWRIEGPIELTMVAPERVALDVSALLGSGSTGHEKISGRVVLIGDRKSTRLNSSHVKISYA